MKVNSFEAFARPDAEILILGSMPGVESLRQQQYYAYPHNSFWRIMGELFDFDYKINYEGTHKSFIGKSHCFYGMPCNAVCVPGSLDSDIKHAKPNDFEKLFKDCPNIKKVFFNGQTAYKLFIKHKKQMSLPKLELIPLAPRPAPQMPPCHTKKNCRHGKR